MLDVETLGTTIQIVKISRTKKISPKFLQDKKSATITIGALGKQTFTELYNNSELY